MNGKYTLAEETKTVSGHTLHRLKALKDFAYARAGQLGGWIETEKNLSGPGDAWVTAEARVFGDAQVFGDALVFGDATVSGNACVSGNARVGDRVWIFEAAWVTGDALVSGKARVSGHARIEDSAWVGDHAWIAGKVRVSGYSRVRDHTRLVNNECVSGHTMIAHPPPPNTEPVYARLKMFSREKVKNLTQIAVETATVTARGGGKC